MLLRSRIDSRATVAERCGRLQLALCAAAAWTTTLDPNRVHQYSNWRTLKFFHPCRQVGERKYLQMTRLRREIAGETTLSLTQVVTAKRQIGILPAEQP